MKILMEIERLIEENRGEFFTDEFMDTECGRIER